MKPSHVLVTNYVTLTAVSAVKTFPSSEFALK